MNEYRDFFFILTHRIFLFIFFLVIRHNLPHTSIPTCVCVLQDGNSVAPETGQPGTAVPWLLAHSAFAQNKTRLGETMMLCTTCITTCSDLQGSSGKQSQNTGLPLLTLPSSDSQALKYDPADEDEVIKRILATGGGEGRAPMAVAFLLGLCLQHSSTCLHMSDVRRLLLHVASGVQNAVWVSSWEEWGLLVV